MISKRDSKPFKVKFPIGISRTNKDDMNYQNEWQTVYGLISEPSGSIFARIYGNELDCDKTITVNASDLTRSISYDTAVLVDNFATSVFENGDYKVKIIRPEYNGVIVIGLSKIESIHIPKLYFVVDGNVLYYQINFDKKTLKAYIPVNSSVNFKTGDYVWTREPNLAEPSKNRLRIISSSKIGPSKNYKPFIELVFVEE